MREFEIIETELNEASARQGSIERPHASYFYIIFSINKCQASSMDSLDKIVHEWCLALAFTLKMHEDQQPFLDKKYLTLGTRGQVTVPCHIIDFLQ